MFLLIEHPLIDMRAFLKSSGRLVKPTLPLATPGVDFIRATGVVKRRARGGVDEWAGENIYVDATQALRFKNRLGRVRCSASDGVYGLLRCSTRRFYSDGIVGRFQVGIKFELDRKSVSCGGNDGVGILQNILTLPIRITVSGAVASSTISSAGKQLAKRYMVTTTHKDFLGKSSLENWWVACGTPLVMIHDPLNGMVPRNRKHISGFGNISLFHAWVEIGQTLCSVWFISGAGTDTETSRRLRIHLSCIHSEREGLRIVLSQVLNNRFDLENNPDCSDLVQQYLNDSLRSIQKSSRFGFDQTSILNAACMAYDFALEGDSATLSHMRKQVVNKVEGYIARTRSSSMIINNIQGNVMNTTIQMGNISVQGDFNLVTAERIENSFNKVRGADVKPELKEKVEAASIEVAKLASKLPSDAAEVLSRDLEAFTSEAISATPRRKWYELSADGILEAAKTVAEMTTSVTAAVTGVLALLS